MFYLSKTDYHGFIKEFAKSFGFIIDNEYDLNYKNELFYSCKKDSFTISIKSKNPNPNYVITIEERLIGILNNGEEADNTIVTLGVIEEKITHSVEFSYKEILKIIHCLAKSIEATIHDPHNPNE